MTPDATPEPENEPIRRPDVEARMREIERIRDEIAKVRDEIEADRVEAVEVTEEERAGREAWDEMTPEEKMDAVRDLQAFLEESRDEIAKSIPEANVEEAITRLNAGAERVERLRRLEEELMELVLQTNADQADVATRLVVSMAEMMRTMENFTEEDWRDIAPAERVGMMDLLNEWNGGRKELVLGQLPIELRRRYE